MDSSILATKSVHLTFDVFGPWLTGQQGVNTLKSFPRSGRTFFRRSSIHHPSFTLFCLVALFRVVAIAASVGRRRFSFLKPIAAGTLHNDVHVGRRQPAKNTQNVQKNNQFRMPIRLSTIHRKKARKKVVTRMKEVRIFYFLSDVPQPCRVTSVWNGLGVRACLYDGFLQILHKHLDGGTALW